MPGINFIYINIATIIYSLFSRNPFVESLYSISSLQKTAFQGLSLQEAKRGVSDSFIAENRSSFASVLRRGLEVTARTTGASKTIEAEVDKPLGLTLGQKPGGRVIISVSSAISMFSIFNLRNLLSTKIFKK